MPAYLREVRIPKCQACGLKATVEVLTGANERIVDSCKICGERLIDRWNQDA